MAGDSSAGSPDVEDCLRLIEEVWPPVESPEVAEPHRLGRFTIVRELGRGGFGVVFLAEDPLLGRRVAVKVPRIGVLADSEAWRGFLRESRAASRLDHPNLVPLLEAGAIGPVGYIVSAYVPGPSLEQWLRRSPGRAPIRWTARLVATLAHAIAHMHQRGILHRDLKPANVLLHGPDGPTDGADSGPGAEGRDKEWVPRICDFGLAKLQEIDGDETRSRVACGSPPYMAPEQAEARQVDIGPATDVYGLGTILYELLTGRPPFRGENDLETLRRVVVDEPSAPRRLRPGVPRDLETICRKCLEKRPEQRYHGATALADDLERFLDGRPIAARRSSVGERAGKWARRHPLTAALALAALLAALSGLGGLLGHNAVLREKNEQLRLMVDHAERSAREALDQGQRADREARRLRRQLAGQELFRAQEATAAGNFERVRRLLDAVGPELGPPENRGFAYSYLRRLARDNLVPLTGHRALVNSLTTSPDDRTLASADECGEIRLWDLETHRSRTLGPLRNQGHRYVVTRWLVFSPDNQTLASADPENGEVSLWDVRSARLRGRLAQAGAAAISSIFVSTDGTRLVATQFHQDPRRKPYQWWDIRGMATIRDKMGHCLHDSFAMVPS